jgi:predicted nucleotidyltransferase
VVRRAGASAIATFSPTPYGDINAILREILASVRAILGDRFRAMYVEGSLALGDFDPASSDIDFVVTAEGLRPQDIESLQGMHARLAATDARWGTDLEATYIPEADLRRYDAGRAIYPRIERGPGEWLRVQQHEIDWLIHLHILREHSIRLAGPPARELIDPIQPDELRQAMATLMRVWWAPMLHNPSRLQRPGYLAYAVLTMCRMLYTLQHGAVVSKPAAARWAQTGPARRWTTLIDRALAGTLVVNTGSLRKTLDLIQFTAERCQHDDMKSIEFR